MAAGWRFEFHVSQTLPPLAWIARVRHPVVEVHCGASVRRTEAGFFEGTWVGRPALESVVESPTTFGTGIVADPGGLFVVPPGHTLEGIYSHRRDGVLLFSNSLVGLLRAADIDLLRGVDYISLFNRIADGLDSPPIELPTSGRPVSLAFYENLHVAADGNVTTVRKRREEPFRSYADYVSRLRAALESALRNAVCYEPVISLSAGYDSTSLAVLAAPLGCRRALTFPNARPVPHSPDTSDSGEPTARRLGMDVVLFDRLAYRTRDDLPEAEFLATGMSGEDVNMVAMEPALARTVLISGMVANGLWRYGRIRRSDLWRTDLSGCSMTEFRLRVDLVYLPLPVFGMTQQPSLQKIAMSAEMRPWSVGGYYDQPIPRRIIEESGIPRGAFASAKRATTALLHMEGARAMAPATLASVTAFAAREGSRLDLAPRARPSSRYRLVQRWASRLHLRPLADRLMAYRRTLISFKPETGSILLRWAVEQVAPRYDTVRGAGRGAEAASEGVSAAR